MPSTRFSLQAVDWRSIGRGAIVALAGAALAYVPMFLNFQYVIGTFDITPFVAAALAVVANILRKFVSDNS